MHDVADIEASDVLDAARRRSQARRWCYSGRLSARPLFSPPFADVTPIRHHACHAFGLIPPSPARSVSADAVAR